MRFHLASPPLVDPIEPKVDVVEKKEDVGAKTASSKCAPQFWGDEKEEMFKKMRNSFSTQ